MTNEELQKEMIAAMKAKDKVRLSIIRQVKAEVKNIEVNERRDVTEEDVNSMIKRLIKQTSETLEMSIKAGTDQERTDNLTEQVKILESLLPAQVSGEELEALIEKVIAELTRRGLRVGSLKHHGHHGFDIDVPAKDTWRHHQAGSKHVGLICATRWAEYADTREEDEMPARELLSRYNDVDVVIIEGYKTEGFDNIVVARSGVDRLRGKSSLDLVDGHTLALACNEALARQAFDAGFATRAININDARAICDLIQDHLA